MTDQDAHADRITRLEEALLFAERRLDQLHEEVLGLAGAVERVSTRLAALERHTLAQSPADDPEPGEDPAPPTPG